MFGRSRRFLCAVLVGALCVGAAGAADATGNLTPKGAQAYLDAIAQLQGQYGTASIASKDSPLSGMWQGLSLAQLVDFDGDGTPELYCGSFSGQHLYTYDGELVDLKIPERVSNFGTDVSPTTLLYIDADKAYLVDGYEVMNGGEVQYLTKQGNQMTAALTYVDAIGENPDGTWGAHICTVNGQPVSSEELESALAQLTTGMTEKNYSYWDILSEQDTVEGTVQQTIAALRALTNPTAVVSSHKVTVDGEPVSLAAYEIGGNNYFKLRDLAQALSGTAAQFEVAWNGAAQRIDLTAGTAYTPVGGELAALPTGSKAAALTKASVYLGDTALELTAYEIGGNNYFKLRDLGAALDFAVQWDGAAQTVAIDTDAPYTE
ncbi:MAG TPA: copper amine oxidase N-terminal domain-containing protein [Candidatus Agathobaculum pullicola]|nr:copper amine oxidase N-terminal domain-containing protein [Candidatus Agathobaculum pullicola]